MTRPRFQSRISATMRRRLHRVTPDAVGTRIVWPLTPSLVLLWPPCALLLVPPPSAPFYATSLVGTVVFLIYTLPPAPVEPGGERGREREGGREMAWVVVDGGRTAPLFNRDQRNAVRRR